MPPQLNHRQPEQHSERHHQNTRDLRLPATTLPAGLQNQTQD